MKYEIPVMWFVKYLLDPLIVLLSLFIIKSIYGVQLNHDYLLLGAVAFLLTSRIFKKLELYETWQQAGLSDYGRAMLVGWGLAIGSLILVVWILQLDLEYSRRVLTTWFITVPVTLFILHWGLRRIMLHTRLQPRKRSVIVVGGNKLGLQLTEKITKNPYLYMDLKGYFDDRGPERLDIEDQAPCLGSLDDIPGYVKQNRVHHIYIALPMMVQPRIMRLLDELRDTTASVYFVPDLFVFDLANARFSEISSMPVIAVSDTPFTGVNAIIKRASDLILGSILLVLLSPLLLAIAIGIKLSSPGPVFFRQRRYGLDGREIIVWKFRSMNVWEDGSKVTQAVRDDPRVTPIGDVLRRTSLDELPQFINVVQGNMSIVGPRPHAVAHNEMYRSLVKGYMIRHKVKPGITGLAQVNGLRGETETLEKMEERIKYDLEYLRNWSLTLDLLLIARTVLVVFKDKEAY